MLFHSSIIALLASASLVAGAAFPGGDKYTTTCKAEYKTKTRTEEYKSTYYETKTKTEPYVTSTTKTYVTGTDVPYTTIEYKTNVSFVYHFPRKASSSLQTKYVTETKYNTKTIPVVTTTYVYKTEAETKVDKSTYVESKP